MERQNCRFEWIRWGRKKEEDEDGGKEENEDGGEVEEGEEEEKEDEEEDEGEEADEEKEEGEEDVDEKEGKKNKVSLSLRKQIFFWGFCKWTKKKMLFLCRHINCDNYIWFNYIF